MFSLILTLQKHIKVLKKDKKLAKFKKPSQQDFFDTIWLLYCNFWGWELQSLDDIIPVKGSCEHVHETLMTCGCAKSCIRIFDFYLFIYFTACTAVKSSFLCPSSCNASCLGSTASSWTPDLRTPLCSYTSGQLTRKMGRVWWLNTVNVTLKVKTATISLRKG